VPQLEVLQMRPSVLASIGIAALAAAAEPFLAARLTAQGEKPASGKSGAACAALTKLTFEGNTTVTAASVVDSGSFVTPGRQSQTLSPLPAFCRVVGVSRPTSDSTINFEVWLPSDSRNGKFLSSGEGGYAGTLNYTRSGLDGGLDELIRRGYASASTDTGHLSADTNWAIGHREKVIDYAYRSKHLVTVASKGLIAAYYGRSPSHSYFSSCSNGGRQALIEAQRFPEDYDGFVVGAPGTTRRPRTPASCGTLRRCTPPGRRSPHPSCPRSIRRCSRHATQRTGLRMA